MLAESEPVEPLEEPEPADATAPEPAGSADSEPAAPPPSEPPSAPTPSVLGEPSGLFCRDLRDRGYTYSEAVDYWYYHGQPERMDVGYDGVPCTTVYPASEVASVYGSPDPAVLSEPAGLFCRDLSDRGYSYADAVAYWEYHGRPGRMDVGYDGVPCTTVYPADEVNAYYP